MPFRLSHRIFCVLEPTCTETYMGNSYCNTSRSCFRKGYFQCYLLWTSCFIRLKQLFHTLETVVSYAWNSCFIRLKQWGCGILQRKSPVNKRWVGTFSRLSQNLVFFASRRHLLLARCVVYLRIIFNVLSNAGEFLFFDNRTYECWRIPQLSLLSKSLFDSCDVRVDFCCEFAVLRNQKNTIDSQKIGALLRVGAVNFLAMYSRQSYHKFGFLWRIVAGYVTEWKTKRYGARVGKASKQKRKSALHWN